MKKNTPQYFCENCGSEVPEKARVCTNCGKFFAAVRCPKCGNTGMSKEFKNGCPKCGYSGSKSGNIQYKPLQEKNRNEKTSVIKNFIAKHYPERSKSKNDSLPAWIYITTAALLIVILAAAYSCYSGSKLY